MPWTIVLTAACFALAASRATADGPIMPDIELQSEPLTPGLTLDESRRPIHQIRLFVKVDEKGTGGRGALVLDPNVPEFDEFGRLVGGIKTPQVSGKGGPLPALELSCGIEFIKAGEDKWFLSRLRGPKLTSPLLLARRGQLGDGGPVRLLVLGDDKKVKAVIALTTYGLVVP